MSCAGTYIGGCCEVPNLRNERIVSEVSQTGFYEFGLRNRQQLYAYADSFVVWNFSNPLTGQSYSGSHSYQAFFDEGARIPRYADSGDVIPTLDAGALIWLWYLEDLQYDPTLITARVMGRYANGGGAAVEVGNYVATLGNPLPLAEQVALENVLAYNPATGANPGNCSIYPHDGFQNFGGYPAHLYRGTFAPFPSAFQPRAPEPPVFGLLGGTAFGSNGYEGLTATASRLMVVPSALNLLRLRSWTFRDRDRNLQGGWPAPGNYLDCQTIDLANGADVVVSSVPDDGSTDKDRIIFAGITLDVFPKAGPAPC